VNLGLATIAIAAAQAQHGPNEGAPIMVRLDEALAAVSEALEAALQAAVPRIGATHVVLGNPAEASAKHGETSQGRFLVTLAALHAGAGRPDPDAAPPEGAGSGRERASALEADLLITADFPGQYLRGLRMMAAALDWAHDHPVLTPGNSADAVEPARFTVEFVGLGFEDAAALVAMAGVRGCPFAVLRLRGLSVGAPSNR
jgi:hypothetical protein